MQVHSRWRVVVVGSIVGLLASGTVEAQRQLSWDSLDVTATLDQSGVLDVVEQQTMVFSGDWNGGERIFNVRPRQRFQFVGIERIDGGQRIALHEDSSLDDVDAYAFAGARTLRWRSRLPSDPAFANTRITYAIHYRLSGILLKEGDGYVLDHDFAFPDRDGDIRRFSLRLSFDAGWQPASDVREIYSAGPIPPNRSYVLKIPLRYSGAGAPMAIDTSRPREVVIAVSAILGVLALAVLGLFVREQRLGRFAPVTADRVDAAWIEQNILTYPAEVVGAAWDQDVDKDEVAAVISRLVSEGKLTSQVATTASRSDLSLQLQAPRESFADYERTLIDGLFFDGRTTTSTDEVKAHYGSTGYDPAKAIEPGLQARVKALQPGGDDAGVWPWPSLALFLIGVGLLIRVWWRREGDDPTAIIVGFVSFALAGICQIPGVVFRQRIDWGIKAMLAFLVMPVLTALGVVALLWYRVGTGEMDWPVALLAAVTVLAIWIVWTAINGLKSRNHRETIAFRKKLAAGRVYFKEELSKANPALRDEWYPWIAAFGLTNEMSRWAVQHPSDDSSSHWRSTSSDRSSSSGSFGSSEPAWTGAGGGRSGGAGGGAAWAAAVGGMAAGVSAPSSSSSGGSSSGSSSGGSSGGGGGGGW